MGLEVSDSTHKRGTHMYSWPSLAVAAPSRAVQGYLLNYLYL